jgi:hypothetical protein
MSELKRDISPLKKYGEPEPKPQPGIPPIKLPQEESTQATEQAK